MNVKAIIIIIVYFVGISLDTAAVMVWRRFACLFSFSTAGQLQIHYICRCLCHVVTEMLCVLFDKHPMGCEAQLA